MRTLKVKKYNQEGDMAHEYRPLRNKLASGDQQESETGQQIKSKDLTDFRTTEITVDLDNPLNIECQPSYDGTVNLIINDDTNYPRIINTRFTATENNRYRIINRNQREQTNIYEELMIDQQTRLFRNINRIPRIQFVSTTYFGQLKGGNYTFYVKFADNDFNKTDVVCESGQISVFNGTISDPKTITGTLQDERTDKAVSIRINNIDTSFQKVYLYYTRESCDINGVRITETCMIKEPYDIKSDYLDITINGFEEIIETNEAELNIKYLYTDRVKTQAQNQGMLFFGNVEMTTVEPRDFQALSLYINVELAQSTSSIGYVNEDYSINSGDDAEMTEYYNPQNIYYNLGYWPDEIYRLGIVYIMRDDSLSDVFNLRGIKFTDEVSTNILYDAENMSQTYKFWWDGLSMADNPDITQGNSNEPWLIDNKPVVSINHNQEPQTQSWDKVGIRYIPKDDFIVNGQYLDNTMGVFKIPNKKIFTHTNDSKGTYPLYFRISFPDHLQERLRSMGVKGFFIVRQKRIPTILCQGLSIGVDKASHVPVIPKWQGEENSTNGSFQYITEGFINENGVLTTNYKEKNSNFKATSALLSIDPCTTPSLQSTFDGSEYTLQKYEPRYINTEGLNQNRVIVAEYDENNIEKIWGNDIDPSDVLNKTNVIFVDSDVPFKYMANQSFSTRAGAAEEVKQLSFFGTQNYQATNTDLLRGIWCPILGLSNSVQDGWIYNIRIKNYSTVFEQEYFKIRGNDNSPFYAITDRYTIETEFTETNPLSAYRGDCYTCTVSMRLQRNFTDSDVPTNEIIIDPNTWKDNYAGYNTTEEDAWLSINRGDVNTVPIGSWITWKCYSNYNLSLRSQDYTNVEEMALMGNPRSFYPITGNSTAVANKIEDSWKLNSGYSATVGRKTSLPVQDVPYIRDIFDTRIMFSNIQQDDAFQNAYRIFQGLSYKDMDRQYGGLVKLISWGTSLLAIFEHGITIIPVNEKALMATTAGQSVHVYGDGVLQKQMTIISQDYGSIWQESIIRTPLGVYGVDTYAKKIWRFSQDKGLELISDAKIQRYLNDHIKLKEKDKYPTVALRNVKSHYNNYKGDIMFTFYNDTEDEEWNLCYNERLDKWSTRYSWIPLYSENVNNIYYSLDKKRAEILAYIYDNLNAEVGIVTDNTEVQDIFSGDSNLWTNLNFSHRIHISTKGYEFFKYFYYRITDIKSSYIDENGIETFIDLSDRIDQIITIQNTTVEVNAQGTICLPENGGKVDTSNSHNDAIFEIPSSLLKYNDKQLYYLSLTIESIPFAVITTGDIQSQTSGNAIKNMYGIIVEYNTNILTSEQQIEYDNLLQNGFYVHGRAGIFDEIDYFDESRTNEILPTVWYDKQEPFEFEFVVNEPAGLHKIFNNLVIISNNVQPSEIEYEIVGDVYGFNKAGIFWKQNNSTEENAEWSNKYNTPIQFLPKAETERTEYPYTNSIRERWVKNQPIKTSEEFKNTTVEWDPILNQYLLKTNQKCYDIKEYGRMRGNITYKEDAWYLTIDPIRFRKADSENSAYGVTGNIEIDDERLDWKSTRIRDKWCKIRIKYTGKDLVLISAIKTMIMTSYA